MLPPFEYLRPTTLNGALAALSEKPSRIHAGGTDLLGCLRDGVFEAGRVVSLSGLEALRVLEDSDEGGLRLGALVPVATLAEHPRIIRDYPGLAEAAGLVASPQLRNQGTLGGNLCQKPRCWYYRGNFPCLRKGGATCFAAEGDNARHAIFGGDLCVMVHPSDIAPMLVSLAAVARIVGPGGDRVVPVENLYVPPAVDFTRETVIADDEILTEIYLPPTLSGSDSSYRKVRTRQSWDFALVGVALQLVRAEGLVRQARVTFSGVAPLPWRSRPTEEILVGQRLDESTIRRAAAAAVTGAESLTKNGYKLDLLGGLVREQLTRAATTA